MSTRLVRRCGRVVVAIGLLAQAAMASAQRVEPIGYSLRFPAPATRTFALFEPSAIRSTPEQGGQKPAVGSVSPAIIAHKELRSPSVRCAGVLELA